MKPTSRTKSPAPDAARMGACLGKLARSEANKKMIEDTLAFVTGAPKPTFGELSKTRVSFTTGKRIELTCDGCGSRWALKDSPEKWWQCPSCNGETA